MTAPTDSSAHRGGPPLLAAALAWAVLTVVAAVLHPGTRPGADPLTTLDALRAHPGATALSATALLASALPLAVWVAAVHHRLTRLGLRVAGPTLGLAGGLLAAAALATSAAAGWSAGSVAAGVGVPGDSTAVVAAGLVDLAFVTGGATFAVAFGLLVAGVSVPVGLARLVPRAVVIAGLVLAAAAVVSVLSLVVPALGVLLPVVRFGGLVWLLWISAVLPVSRRRAATGPAAAAGTGERAPEVVR